MQIELTNQSFFLKLSLIFVDMTISTMRTFLATLQSPSGARDAECLLLLQSFCMLYSRVAEGLMRHLRPIPQMVDWSNSFMEHLLSKLDINADMLRFVFSLVPRKPFLSVSVSSSVSTSPQSTQSQSASGSGSSSGSGSVAVSSPAVVVVPSAVSVPVADERLAARADGSLGEQPGARGHRAPHLAAREPERAQPQEPPPRSTRRTCS